MGIWVAEVWGGKLCRGCAEKRGVEKLLDFHRNTVVTDPANTAALSFLLFTVKWQWREIVDGYYPKNKFSWKPEFMQINWPLGKLRNKGKRKVPIWNTRQYSVRSGRTAGPTSAAWVDLSSTFAPLPEGLGGPWLRASPPALQRLSCSKSLGYQHDLSTAMLSRLETETVNHCGQRSSIG